MKKWNVFSIDRSINQLNDRTKLNCTKKRTFSKKTETFFIENFQFDENEEEKEEKKRF